MVDEQPPAKKVVKRVVKKTVVRPASASTGGTTLRYGRPSSSTTPAPKARAAAPPRSVRPRPRIEVTSKVSSAGRSIGARGSRAASGALGAAGSASRTTGSYVSGRARAARAWRVPHLDPVVASILTGAVVGLITVGLGLGAKAAFSELRGVSAGGGGWGSLTVVVLAFIAFALGELLLSLLGSAHARMVSFLGVVITIVAVLVLPVGLADTVWSLLLVPGLGALAFVVADRLLDVAEKTPKVLD